MTARTPEKNTPAPTGATFAERARARAEAEKKNPPPPRRRVTLRAGANAEAISAGDVTHVQN